MGTRAIVVSIFIDEKTLKKRGTKWPPFKIDTLLENHTNDKFV
jgi:hypothetical protein